MVDLILTGIVLVLAGMGIMVASVASQANRSGGGVKGGGVVMIGPIPIIFGSDAKWASVALVLAIALIVLWLVVALI